MVINGPAVIGVPVRRDMSVRRDALEMAIQVRNAASTADSILADAKKFETYILDEDSKE